MGVRFTRCTVVLFLAAGECWLQEMEKVYVGRYRPVITFCSFPPSLLSIFHGALYTLSLGGLF
jgi:hypothetical protein